MVTVEKAKLIRDMLKSVQDRQESYAYQRRKELGFSVGDMIFLKISPWKSVIRFHNRGKLNPPYIGPFTILERIGSVAYRLELPSELEKIHNVFHISMLKKYKPNSSHILEEPLVELSENLSFEVQSIKILDRQDKAFCSKVIPVVKVLWRSDCVEEMTSEPKAAMLRQHPHLFDKPS